MKRLLGRLGRHAIERPALPAIRDAGAQLDSAALDREVERLSGMLPASRVGLLLGNGVPWACLDLAMLKAERVCVPMPGFFTDAQLRHLVADAGLDLVATDQPERVAALLHAPSHSRIEVAGQPVWLFWCNPEGNTRQRPTLPAGTVKITYTSGTTGQPKGVCLSGDAISKVTESLCDAVQATWQDRALSLLPLSTLLENIAGLYAPLWAGALAQLPDLAQCGLAHSAAPQPTHLIAALDTYAPNTITLVPQLLKLLVGALGATNTVPESLRFVAVGGAPTPPALLEQARACGLPVFQGYGLSEAGSVVCLNTPSADRNGSVGRPLPHLQLLIADDGEVLVTAPLLLGYLGDIGHAADKPWCTGDLGYLDADGFLFLTGRKKTAYATAYGRNVSPEWVESELCSHPLIAQAAVFGEGQALNVAVLVPDRKPGGQDFQATVDRINRRLPDYAQIARWLIADQAFSPANGLANGAGCVRRQAVWQQYQTRIEALYFTEQPHVLF